MPRYRCDQCGQIAWSEGDACPWCGSPLIRPANDEEFSPESRVEVARPPHRARKSVQVIDAIWTQGSSEGRPQPLLRTILVAAVVGIVGLVLVLAQSGLLLTAANPRAVAKVQMFTKAGETWQINASSPHVLFFTTAGASLIWMNLSLHNGISIVLCDGSVVIHAMEPLPIPGCPKEAGGTQRQNGSWGPVVAGGWELGFINYGPASGYLPTVTLTWITPLVVEEN